MQRKIKFRVWDSKYNLLIRNKEDIEKIKWSDVDNDYFYDEDEYWNYPLLIEMEINIPERFILEQYTGVKDVDGVEIYEGDVVEYENDSYIVHYNAETLSYDLKDFNERNQCPLWFFSKCKVVGNIHEVKK